MPFGVHDEGTDTVGGLHGRAVVRHVDADPQSMETLFLLTLDELGEHLSALLSDRYASHALRVLLMVLSGRPLDRASNKSLLQSKKKEFITVQGAPALGDDAFTQTRVVPSSFAWAVRKIITDITSSMDPTALRVLATHPTGNPVLQLLLELDISSRSKEKGKKPKDASSAEENPEEQGPSLLERLLPDAPSSFGDSTSEASSFVSGMLYDPIGSRLLECIITHCPGKVFKGLYANLFAPRIHTFLRNDIASYPAIQVLNRLSKEDLAAAVQKSLSEVPVFVEKGRFNVLKTLFERCHIRQASEEIDSLLKALVSACGKDWKFLVPKLCSLDEDAPQPEQKFQKDSPNNKTAMVSHGSQLLAIIVEIPGTPSKAVQASIQSLTSDQIIRLATSTPQTANILVKALTMPSQNPQFHKILVSKIASQAIALTESRQGQDVLNAIIAAPSKGEGISVPFHLKENVMSQLAAHESALRDTWLGRNIWRTWKGDLWNRRRFDWVRWAKETDEESARVAKVPASKLDQPPEQNGKPKRKSFAKDEKNADRAVTA